MSNQKLEIIKSLEELENKKKNMQLVELALESPYFEDATISVAITTKDYKDKGTDESISINSNLFLDYIKSEIKDIDAMTHTLVNRLSAQYMIDMTDKRR